MIKTTRALFLFSPNFCSVTLNFAVRNSKSAILTGALLLALCSAPCSAADAQQPTKIPRVGFLAAGSPSTVSARIEACRHGLRELGYREDKNIVIERRFTTRHSERRPMGVQGVLMLQSAILNSHRKKAVDLALKGRLPTMYYAPEFLDAGGLLAYATNITDLYRRAAIFVDKILKGAKPAELPVEQPAKFELAINLRTARQIGFTIPPNVLARADNVIK